MNKEWVDKKNEEFRKMIESDKKFILNEIKTSKWIPKKNRIEYMGKFYKGDYNLLALDFELLPVSYISDEYSKKEFDDIREYGRGLADKLYRIYHYYVTYGKDRYGIYLDREMDFDGDIIITDPCYIMREDYHGTQPLTDNDWAACNYGSNMEVFGFTKYMVRGTIYGDWGCTTFDTDTNEVIGHFCADAGLVGVFLLDEVLKYNPAYTDLVNNNHTVTWVKDFKGTVRFVVNEEKFEYNNKECTDYAVEVVGHGINKRTGKPINFVGKQTSL